MDVNASHAPRSGDFIAHDALAGMTGLPTSSSQLHFVALFLSITLLCLLYCGASTKAFHVLQSPFNAFRQHISRRLLAWRFLTSGPSIIHDAYLASDGKPFEVLAPDARYVFVTSPAHVKEIDSSEQKLSLYYASRQILQPQYTMHRFGWFDRPLEGQGFIRALRIHLTNRVPNIVGEMMEMMEGRWEMLMGRGEKFQGGVSAPIAKTVVKTVAYLEAHVIFGAELAKSEEFLDNAVLYIEQLALCAEIIRAAPEWMAPIIGNITPFFHKAQKYLFDNLMPIVTARCYERELALTRGDRVPKHSDCIQWLLESAPSKVQRTPKGVAHELMAIWFAALHPISVTITYALQDLCLRPEYMQPIRNEILDSAQAAHFRKTGTGLHLLDSFIKESARLSPVESQSVRRRSVEPFTLSDGTQLSPGDWACTPVTSMMSDAKWYPSPDEFSGFRFAPKDVVESLGMEDKPRQEKSSVFVDGDETYMWGVGKNGCPGRYYASTLAKVVIGYLVTKYDMELLNPEVKRWWTWRTTRVPCEDVMVVFRERTE